MVGNRQTQIFFLNSKCLNNFASFGRLDCFFLINSRIYEHLKQFLHFLTTNLWKNSILLLFFFFYQNHHKSTNVDFCDKSYCRSLVETLKYLFNEFQICTTLFEEIRPCWKWKIKKIIFFFVDRIHHYVLRGISTFFTVFHSKNKK